MNPAFWQGKKVFITGHTGFKGSWMSLWLYEIGAEVSGYALKPQTDPNLYELADVKSGISSTINDVRNLNELKMAMYRSKPEIVFHLAAQPLVRMSYANPVETYATNVMGTVNVLEAVRQISTIKVVVIVTTDKCYENKEWYWAYRENEALGGYDPYSSSKACAELVTNAYRQSYFNPRAYDKHGVAIASVRAGNVIGGGDWSKDRLIPDLVAAFQANKVAQIRNPEAIRPWQHVLDPLDGYLTLAESLYRSGPEYAEAWNFGPSEEDAKSVKWIADLMIKLWASGANWEALNCEQMHEATYLKLDTSKARNKLGWKPKIDLEKALDLTIDWVKKISQGESARKVTLKQIKNYQLTSSTSN